VGSSGSEQRPVASFCVYGNKASCSMADLVSEKGLYSTS